MSPLAEAITTALLHSLWQDALIAAGLAVVLAVLRRRSANARYLAACAALACMVAVPIATAVVSTAAPSKNRTTITAPETASAASVSVWTSAVAFSGTVPSPLSEWIELARFWALPTWTVGVLLLSLRLVLATRHAATIKHRAEPADETTTAIVRRLARQMGIAKHVTVLMAPIDDGPGTVGWLAPIILLPPATAMGVTPRQLEGLLAHELAHVRRRDYLVNLVQMVVETLCFYHPAVWWVSRRIRFERELCCDDVAVMACGDAVGYAHALTTLARLRMTMPAVTMAARGGLLVARIRRLLTSADEPRTVSRWPAVLALILVVSTGTICLGWLETQAPATRSSGGTIYGYVYDPLGEPARNIPITLDNNVVGQDVGPIGPALILDTRTDEFGYYQFGNVPPGTWILTPAVAWARAIEVSAPPSGSAQQDLWVAFDTVHTALFANADDRPPRSPQPAPETDDTTRQTIVGPRYVGSRMLAYPDGLRLDGDVVLEGHIGTDGRPRGLRVVSAMEPELARAALADAQGERWEPARVRGIPLEVPVRITVVYRLTLN